MLHSNELKVGGQRTAEEAMQSGPLTVRPNLGLQHLRHRMSDDGPQHVIITDQDGRLLGLVLRSDLK
jgi:CBS-domain-containing membrane protein